MQTSQGRHSTGGVHGFYNQNEPEMNHCMSFDNSLSDTTVNETQMSFQVYDQSYFTLDSAPPAVFFDGYGSPSVVSTSSNRSHYSPQSHMSDHYHSSSYNYGSPVSGSSAVGESVEWRNQLQEIKRSLLGPDSCITNQTYCALSHRGGQEVSSAYNKVDLVMQMVPKMDLKQLLYFCAQAVSDNDVPTAERLMEELDKKVSVTGTPIERLAAYMLEGIRARLEFSGFTIYKKLRCEQPTNIELLSYMHILYQVCPYFQFAYKSANLIIQETMQNERSFHIIDFQIGMGTQWTLLFESLAKWPCGPPMVRITGVDDEHSAYVRGGGLEVVKQRLTKSAESFGVPFEFHAAAMSGSEVNLENLRVQPVEALAVNFPFMLHHMPDESVSTTNHRDRLLRLVKSLSPKVVALVEQESNTNTPPFKKRFVETLDYYTAMFESVDVGLARDDKKRINAEMHCLARDIVNMIACEDDKRVERHEPFGKWKARLNMAGFKQVPVSLSVNNSMRELLMKFHQNYRLQESQGTLYLGWKNRIMSTSSAWV